MKGSPYRAARSRPRDRATPALGVFDASLRPAYLRPLSSGCRFRARWHQLRPSSPSSFLCPGFCSSPVPAVRAHCIVPHSDFPALPNYMFTLWPGDWYSTGPERVPNSPSRRNTHRRTSVNTLPPNPVLQLTSPSLTLGFRRLTSETLARPLRDCSDPCTLARPSFVACWAVR